MIGTVHGMPARPHSSTRPTSQIAGSATFGEAASDVLAGRILVVEDATELAELIAEHLTQIASDVQISSDGHSALETIRSDPPDLVILDIGLPAMSGLEVCRAVRARGDATPILMLSGRSSELDRIVGLEFGADDYLVKPFSMLELLARVRAILRRAGSQHFTADSAPPPATTTGRLHAAPLAIDASARTVLCRNLPVSLTEKEFDLLHLLAANPGRVYSRAQMLDLVWGTDCEVYEDSVTSHISRLRAKLELDPAQPRIIQTVWGIGYRFGPDAA